MILFCVTWSVKQLVVDLLTVTAWVRFVSVKVLSNCSLLQHSKLTDIQLCQHAALICKTYFFLFVNCQLKYKPLKIILSYACWQNLIKFGLHEGLVFHCAFFLKILDCYLNELKWNLFNSLERRQRLVKIISGSVHRSQCPQNMNSAI